MSQKLPDKQGRHRSVTIAFRVSPEEAQVIDSLVATSGLTKQDYITARLENREVTVIPSSRIYKALRDEMSRVYRELRCIRKGGEITQDLAAVIDVLAKEFVGLRGGAALSDTEMEDAAIFAIKRR